MKAKWLILAVVALGLVMAPSIGFTAPTIATTPSPDFSTFTSSNGELGMYLVGS